MRRIKRCGVCGKYTLGQECCGEGTRTAHPPRYSPQDKYAKYRRMERFGRVAE